MLTRLNQSYFSPYFIFIKEGYKISDETILKNLGLSGYELVTENNERSNEIRNKRYLFLTEDKNWTYLMDDWFYTLWHNKEIRNRIKSLSKEFEIFTCSVGDCDDSFDFTYFKQGEIIRQYVVEDPKYKGGEVVKNFGIPFPVENTALRNKDLYTKVMTIAESFGIKMNHEKEKVRIYGKFENINEKFVFNSDEY